MFSRLGLLAICLLPLLGWWFTGLFDLDEGFYGAITREMIRNGEWVIPTLNGEPWFEKPILLYWLAKPCIMLLGPEYGARLPSVICALGLYSAIFSFGSKHFGAKAGSLAGFVAGTSILVVVLGRMMMTDMPLALALACAWFSYWNGLVGSRWNWVLTGFWIGVGVLAKGPIAILLSVPIFGYGAIINRKSSIVNPKSEVEPGMQRAPASLGTSLLATLGGTAMAVLVIATWYWPAYKTAGDTFVQKFLIEQNVNRFLGGDAAHTLSGPINWIVFIPVLILGFAPWIWFLPASWPRKPDDAAAKYLAAAALIPFLFFSAGGAKLPHYILPCFAPLALLVGRNLTPKWKRLPDLAFIWVFVLAILANGGIWMWYRKSGQAEAHRLVRELGLPLDRELIAYQLGRRDEDKGTGKPVLQETSLPSLGFVLDRKIRSAETEKDFPDVREFYIVTRPSRIEDLRADLKKSGLSAQEVQPNYAYPFDREDEPEPPYVIRRIRRIPANPLGPP